MYFNFENKKDFYILLRVNFTLLFFFLEIFNNNNNNKKEGTL